MNGIKFLIFFIIWCFLAVGVVLEFAFLLCGEPHTKQILSYLKSNIKVIKTKTAVKKTIAKVR